MPITSSAHKALRQVKRRRAQNESYKNTFREAAIAVRKLTKEAKSEDVRAILQKAYAALDKAAKHGTIKQGQADRKKSRLAKFVGKLKASQ